jgi:hypothetical protein
VTFILCILDFATILWAQVPFVSPPTPCWVHDFPVTQNWAIIPETPIFFNAQARPRPLLHVFYIILSTRLTLQRCMHALPLTPGPSHWLGPPHGRRTWLCTSCS